MLSSDASHAWEALRRLSLAPDHASGCPNLYPILRPACSSAVRAALAGHMESRIGLVSDRAKLKQRGGACCAVVRARASRASPRCGRWRLLRGEEYGERVALPRSDARHLFSRK